MPPGPSTASVLLRDRSGRTAGRDATAFHPAIDTLTRASLFDGAGRGKAASSCHAAFRTRGAPAVFRHDQRVDRITRRFASSFTINTINRMSRGHRHGFTAVGTAKSRAHAMHRAAEIIIDETSSLSL